MKTHLTKTSVQHNSRFTDTNTAENKGISDRGF